MYMGYFANGIEGESYKSCYCYNCKNWTKRDGEGVEGCPIWDLHLEYNYELCNDPDSFLDKLIPHTEDGLDNDKCVMFLPKDGEKNE